MNQQMTEAPAIFLLANDRVLQNVIQLLSSLKFHGFANPLFYIPYDGNTNLAHKVFRYFGVERYETALDQVVALSRRIYDREPPANPYPYCLGNLRKLSFLTYPGPAVYIDSDCVVTSKP